MDNYGSLPELDVQMEKWHDRLQKEVKLPKAVSMCVATTIAVEVNSMDKKPDKK